MSLNSEEIALIEKYVDNKLSASEQERFQTIYENDDAFKKEADLQRSLISSFKSDNRSRQKQQLLNDYRKFKANKPSHTNSKIKTYTAIGIAASVLIASFIAFFLSSQSSNSLFDEYYTPYSGAVILRGESTQADLINGLELYKNERYAESLIIFKKLLEEKLTNKDELYVLVGICYLEAENTKASRDYFNQVSNIDFIPIRDWYVALSYLKEGDLDRAQPAISTISNSKSPYRHKAKEIYAQLPLVNGDTSLASPQEE